MPRLKPIALLALLAALSAAQLAAAGDWFNWRAPRPLRPGQFELGLELSEVERAAWADGARAWTLPDADGLAKSQKQARLNLGLLWQASPQLSLELRAPLLFSEFSPSSSETVATYALDDPALRRSQGLGDLELGLRRAFTPAGAALSAAWTLGLIAPLGLGPLESPQTLAATGEGRWQILPGLSCAYAAADWDAFVGLSGRVQIGRQASSSSQAYLAWGPQGGLSLGAGALWLAPRYGAEFSGGAAWHWFRGASSSSALACELLLHWLSPWATAAGAGPFGPEFSLVLQPELKAEYGSFGALLGWQARPLWAGQVPLALDGQFRFQLAYAF